ELRWSDRLSAAPVSAHVRYQLSADLGPAAREDTVSDYVLEGHGLQMRYDGRLVLDVPTIGVRRAETLAIIGSNGAGKSTLLRVLALLERPTQGQLRLDGCWVAWGANLLAFRRRFASVFQEPLLVDAPVARNVALGLTLRRVPKAESTDRTRRWMRCLG